MPAVYVLTGAALAFGGVAGLASSISKHEFSFNLLLVSNLIVGGAFLMAAGLKKHRGDWPTLLGVLLIVFSAFGLGSDLDSLAQGQETDISDTLIIVGFFFLSGLLLLLSGQRMHGLVSEALLRKAAAPVKSEAAENNSQSITPDENEPASNR